jgi:formamidopyrimidine-DNA glycosylase
MKSFLKFVDVVAEKSNVHLSPELRKESASRLRIAGAKVGTPRAEHLLLTFWKNQKANARQQNLKHEASGGHLTTAAVVTAGQVCPRCGGEMSPVKLCDQRPAFYCMNPRCRVAAHSGDPVA